MSGFSFYMEYSLQDARKEIDSKKAVRNSAEKKLAIAEENLINFKDNLKYANEALLIIQQVAKQTQEQLEYRISELVSLAIYAVFHDAPKFKVIYETKRNKTEAGLWFDQDGELINPMDADGGGIVDIASFALRVALWSLAADKTDSVLVLDEPFKHLSADLQSKAGKMVKEISARLGLQIIMVSHIDELVDEADKVFRVTQKNKISTVEEV